MTSDSPNFSHDGTNMTESMATLPPKRPQQAGRRQGHIDMKHRRWIDQVLAESQSQSVVLPWTRKSEGNPVGSARKSPQDN